MPDEPKQGEMPPQEEPKETPKEKPAEIASQSKDVTELEAELEKARKALKDANKEAAERRKKIEEFEAAEQKRKEAELSEAEKTALRIKQLETEKADLEAKQKANDRRELQRKVAKAVGLPEGLALRLQGDTEEEMTDDAKSVLELLPKQEAEKKPTVKLDPTNPADAKKGETRAQQKARILGKSVNVFDPEYVKAHGGGATFVEKE